MKSLTSLQFDVICSVFSTVANSLVYVQNGDKLGYRVKDRGLVRVSRVMATIIVRVGLSCLVVRGR